MSRKSLLSIAMQLLRYRNATSPGGGIGRRARFRSYGANPASPVGRGSPLYDPFVGTKLRRDHAVAEKQGYRCAPRKGGGRGGSAFFQAVQVHPPIHSSGGSMGGNSLTVVQTVLTIIVFACIVGLVILTPGGTP